MDFAFPVDDRVKLKERDKYLDFTRELKIWNMKVTVIPVVIDTLGKIPNPLEKGLEDIEKGKQVGNIQTAALLRLTRTLERVLETWGKLLSPKLQWNTLS